jgi:hypothetical protein
MGKKRARKKLTSRGIHSKVSSGIVTALRREVSAMDRKAHKTAAWLKGLNPWITIENPTKQTNKLFIKVRADDLYGNPKLQRFSMLKDKGKAETEWA